MTYNKQTVTIHTLANLQGMEVVVSNFGGRILAIRLPDRQGRLQDVVLGFDDVVDYTPQRHPNDFGALVGRYANRIGNARFTLDGVEWMLPRNNGPHCLHGGPDGWQYRVMEVVECSNSRLTLTLASPDGDNGFPGKVTLEATYTLDDDNAFRIDYRATTTHATPLNITNHSYFNLNGDGSSTCNHLLSIDADCFLPIDDTFLPTGEIRHVDATPMDFRQAKAIGRDIDLPDTQLLRAHGYDHCWLLNTCGDLQRPCARLQSPLTGIGMDLYTTLPGVQLYTGNFLDGTVAGKCGTLYQQHSAVCLETQCYPDSPNRRWPESTGILCPGEVYCSTSIYHFGIFE